MNYVLLLMLTADGRPVAARDESKSGSLAPAVCSMAEAITGSVALSIGTSQVDRQALICAWPLVDGSSQTPRSEPASSHQQYGQSVVGSPPPPVPLSWCRIKGQLWALASQRQERVQGEAMWVFPPALPCRPTLASPCLPSAGSLARVPAACPPLVRHPPSRSREPIPCCPYRLCVSFSLSLRTRVSLVISVGCSRRVRDANPNPCPCPGLCQRQTDRQIRPANQENSSHGQMYPNTKTARNANCSACSGSACSMDFLLATNNCENSSCSIIINGIEGSHKYPHSLLQPLLDSKNSN